MSRYRNQWINQVTDQLFLFVYTGVCCWLPLYWQCNTVAQKEVVSIISQLFNQSVFIYNQSQCLSWFEICKTFFEFLSKEWRNSQVYENVCGILEAVRYKIRLSIYATCWRMVFGFKSVESIFYYKYWGGDFVQVSLRELDPEGKAISRSPLVWNGDSPFDIWYSIEQIIQSPIILRSFNQSAFIYSHSIHKDSIFSKHVNRFLSQESGLKMFHFLRKLQGKQVC